MNLHSHRPHPRWHSILAAPLLLTLAALTLASGCGQGKEKATLGFSSPAHAGEPAAGQPLAATAATAGAAPSAASTTATATRTLPVEVRSQAPSLALTGTLEADEQANVASKASGNVREIYVDRGSLVKRGDRLVQLDPTDARNALAEGEAVAEELRVQLGLRGADDAFQAAQMPDVNAARVALELAERNDQRLKSLVENNAISKIEFDQTHAQYNSAREQYEQALRMAQQTYQRYQTQRTRLATLRQSLADTLIVAPFDGMVAEKLTAVGERVDVMMGGGKVIRLVKIQPLRLKLTVPQQYVGQVRPEQPVDFTVEGFAGQIFQGRVAYIGPALEADSRSLTVEAMVDNASLTLRPGLFANAELNLPGEAAALFVPATALLREGDVARLFVVREGRASERIVTPGKAADGRVEILAGLQKDERIVAEPAGVHDGAVLR